MLDPVTAARVPLVATCDDRSGDPFVDAALGLASACRRLDDPAVCDALVALMPDDRPDMIDALLGALSLRQTVTQVIAGIAGDAAVTAAPEPAGWSRDQLR